MAGRYIVSGVQLGCLLGLGKAGDFDKMNEMVAEIIDNQFIGNSKSGISEDVRKIQW